MLNSNLEFLRTAAHPTSLSTSISPPTRGAFEVWHCGLHDNGSNVEFKGEGWEVSPRGKMDKESTLTASILVLHFPSTVMSVPRGRGACYRAVVTGRRPHRQPTWAKGVAARKMSASCGVGTGPLLPRPPAVGSHGDRCRDTESGDAERGGGQPDGKFTHNCLGWGVEAGGITVTDTSGDVTLVTYLGFRAR